MTSRPREPSAVGDSHLNAARALAARGDDDAARQRYVDLLRLDPDNVTALVELADLAHAGGYREAARTAFLRAVAIAPGDPVAQVGLGDLQMEDRRHADAESHYRAALATDAGFARAHQGLARALNARGFDAEHHWSAGFAGHAVTRQRFRGTGPGIPLLLLVSARGGNVPTKHWIDDRVFAVTAIFAEYFDPGAPLPDHALTVNAIGDADRCERALRAAQRIAAEDTAPLINLPERVASSGRENNARRLAAVPGVIAPRTRRASRTALAQGAQDFPVLLRSPGFHTGENFVRIESHEGIADALASLPGEELFEIAYLDARSADGLARKYRVMIIDGGLHPMHLAISADWKVHYFTAAMAASAALREEERRFLTDMRATLGSRAMAALEQISRVLGLDYAGVDFALAPDGSLLLFEANATMVINPPDPDPIWDYRRPAFDIVQSAARRMLVHHAQRPEAQFC